MTDKTETPAQPAPAPAAAKTDKVKMSDRAKAVFDSAKVAVTFDKNKSIKGSHAGLLMLIALGLGVAITYVAAVRPAKQQAAQANEVVADLTNRVADLEQRLEAANTIQPITDKQGVVVGYGQADPDFYARNGGR